MLHRVRALSVLVVVLVAAAPALAQARTYSPLDEEMLKTSIQGDRFEVAGGKLAQSRGATPEIKSLGARLVKDHAKSLKEAVQLARHLGISVPKTPSPTQEWQLDVVGAMSGTGFDAAYATLEIQDHKQDIEESKTEAREGLNCSVRALARKDLPALRRHLKLSKQALAAVTG
jgi:putative membrane protein